MDPEVTHEDAPHPDEHHHKPRHIAEKLESYVGIIMVVVAAVLFVLVLYAITQTGSGTPSWMK